VSVGAAGDGTGSGLAAGAAIDDHLGDPFIFLLYIARCLCVCIIATVALDSCLLGGEVLALLSKAQSKGATMEME
jgi:hypothetical protein